jgi:hypothetical protein
MARALNSGPEAFGYLALQVAYLVIEAALTRGVRRAFLDRADHIPGAPSLTTSSGSGSPRRRMSWKNSGQLSVFFLLPGAGAVLNVVKSAAGQSIAGLWGRRVGLAGLMAARIAGRDPIIAFDPLPSRLVLARELGASREDFRRDLRQPVMDEV